MAERERWLNGKREELQKNIIKYDKFIRDNETKRARALKKINEEMVATAVRVKEVDELRGKYNDLLSEKKQSEEEIAKIGKYHQYLEMFVRSRNEDFNDLRDVVQRCTILQKTEEYLVSRKKKLDDGLTQTEHEYEKIRKLRLNTLLSENTRIEVLQKGFESQQDKAKLAQQHADLTQHTLRSDMYALGACLMSIDNIFQRVCKSTVLNLNAKESDVIAQLAQVGNFLEDYRSIVATDARKPWGPSATSTSTSSTSTTPTPSISQQRAAELADVANSKSPTPSALVKTTPKKP
eukprot:ANDGO_05430.mRNA.1 Coiled-coil domain-containing protein 42 homolog